MTQEDQRFLRDMRIRPDEHIRRFLLFTVPETRELAVFLGFVGAACKLFYVGVVIVVLYGVGLVLKDWVCG